MLIERGGVVKYANLSARKLLASNSESGLSGKKLVDFIHPEQLTEFETCIEESLNGNRPKNKLLKFRFSNADHNLFLADFLRFGSDGSTTVAVILEQFRLCKVLNQRFDRAGECLLMGLMPDAVYLLNQNGRIEYANQKCAKNFNKTPQELIGLNQTDLFPPEIAKRNIERIKRVLETGEAFNEQVFVPVADGIHWVDKHLFPVFDSDGKAKWVLGFGRNLTAVKEAESKLDEVRGLNEAMIAASSVGFCAYDSSGQCIYVNDALCEYIGGKREEVLRQNFRELKSWRDSGMLYMAQKALSENRPVEGEVCITTSFSKQVWFSCRFVPFLKDGKQHLLLMAVNISDWKNSEKMLKIQRDIAIAISSESELKRILILVLNEILNLDGIDFGGIYLLNCSTNKYELVHSRTGASGNSQVPAEINFQTECWKEFLKPVASYIPGEKVPEDFLNDGVKSLTIIPILEGAAALALIIVGSRNLNRLPEQTKLTLETIAAQISGAVARAKAAEELRNSESFLKAIYDTPAVMHAIFEQTDSEFRCIMCNKAFAKFFNKTPATLLGIDIRKLFGQESWIHLFEQCCPEPHKNILNVEKEFSINGKTFWLLVSCYYLGQSYFKNPCCAVVIVDITHRKEAEIAMSQISRKVYEAQEKERKNVSRELHDSIGQMLVSVNYRLLTLQQELSDKSPEIARSVKKCSEILTKTVKELRAICQKIRPSDLDDFGLVSACESLCKEMAQLNNMAIEFFIDQNYDSLSREFQLHIYRIIQELLNNTIKHSGASKVLLNMSFDSNTYAIEYRDNGCGIDRQRIPDANGLGLVNIEERVGLIGGSIEVASSPGKGFAAKIIIPVKRCE